MFFFILLFSLSQIRWESSSTRTVLTISMIASWKTSSGDLLWPLGATVMSFLWDSPMAVATMSSTMPSVDNSKSLVCAWKLSRTHWRKPSFSPVFASSPSSSVVLVRTVPKVRSGNSFYDPGIVFIDGRTYCHPKPKAIIDWRWESFRKSLGIDPPTGGFLSSSNLWIVTAPDRYLAGQSHKETRSNIDQVSGNCEWCSVFENFGGVPWTKSLARTL